MQNSLKKSIAQEFKGSKQFSLFDAYESFPEKPHETVRARIYDGLGIEFERVKKGVYRVVQDDTQCLIIEGDGRDLSFIEDESVDAIITDHPWLDKKTNKGGSRNFATYDCFKYEQKDFDEKARVLKDGAFLVEMLPAENESNFEYLYELKKMAQKAGFQYYSKVPWTKGTFVSNTGRKAKNTEDMMFFTKGKPRKLRPDKQRGVIDGVPTRYMSGAAGMLPTTFNVQAVPRKQQISQSEKPVNLVEQILEFISLPGEWILDQFAGSGVVGEACLNQKRNSIIIEQDHDKVENIKKRLSNI